MEHFPLMLATGRSTGDPLVVTSPWGGDEIGTVDRAGGNAVEAALALAAETFADRNGWLSREERGAILRRAARIVAERRELLAEGIAAEGGKPLADARIETDRAVSSLELCADAIRAETGSEVPMGLNPASEARWAFTTHEPRGVVVAISAFNHPLNLIAHQVGPAVAAGCPFIVKPAEDTPLSCMRLIGILREAGLPEAWGQACMTTDVGVSEKLATDHRVAFLSFIGSAGVGWYLRSQIAPGTRCALEHGGLAPVIVSADADLDDLVPRILKGGLYHAGQVCVSVQRVLAEESIADQLAEMLSSGAASQRVGDPADEMTDVGPLIRPGEVDRVGEWVAEAVASGGRLLTGGEPVGRQAYAPTVIADPDLSCRLMREEIFGPVVSVHSWDSLDAAVALANAPAAPFQASVFTREIDIAMRVARRVDASAILVNDHTAFRVDWMPFAGLGASGLGTGGIPFTYADMRVEKMIAIRSDSLG